MSENSQAIVSPFGVTVFGSAVMRAPADVAVVSCSVSRLEKNAERAFAAARAGAQAVQDRLRALRVEAGASRIMLSQQNRYANGETVFAGYLARVSIRALINELDRVEQIVCDVVNAGANEIDQVSFETRRLKDIRAEARRMAIVAAREKAENYCLAAGVALGPVMHIEDINPELVQGRGEGHSSSQAPPQDEESHGRAFDPSSIAVTAAVVVAYGMVRGAE